MEWNGIIWMCVREEKKNRRNKKSEQSLNCATLSSAMYCVELQWIFWCIEFKYTSFDASKTQTQLQIDKRMNVCHVTFRFIGCFCSFFAFFLFLCFSFFFFHLLNGIARIFVQRIYSIALKSFSHKKNYKTGTRILIILHIDECQFSWCRKCKINNKFL